MKYKCCDYLMHQIVFDQFDIKPCCESSMNNDTIRFADNFDGKNFDINSYISKRNNFIRQFKNGDIPKGCQGCPLIKEQEWDEDDISLNRIIMANIAKCSCNCIYCVYTHDNPEKKHYFNTKENYDIKPLLLSLRNQNMIRDKFILIIGGGECTEFEKGLLEWLLYFAASMDGYVQILSSGIKYSSAVEKFLEKGHAELVISPDAGTKKTYEKIKQVKAFDRVWNNMKRYSEAVSKSKISRMAIKYIIIPGVNDNLEEVKSFTAKCRETLCRNIHIDIEHYWFKENKQNPPPQSVRDIMNYFAEQKDFDFNYSAETEYWLR